MSQVSFLSTHFHLLVFPRLPQPGPCITGHHKTLLTKCTLGDSCLKPKKKGPSGDSVTHTRGWERRDALSVPVSVLNLVWAVALALRTPVTVAPRGEGQSPQQPLERGRRLCPSTAPALQSLRPRGQRTHRPRSPRGPVCRPAQGVHVHAAPTTSTQ